MTKKAKLGALSPGQRSVEESIVDQIFEAVIDQRLPPGTKLSESALCDAFAVGRMHIRRSLLLLASRELVEIISNKGAFVATPSAKQARDVFEARLAIEPMVARLAVQRADFDDFNRLKQHVHKEAIAHERVNRRDAIKLSGVFHILIAEIADNGVMLRTTKELIARATLIMGIFGAPGMTSCRDDDHSEILSAFESGDGERAAALMTDHLTHIQSQMNLDQPNASTLDLTQIFARQ